MSQTVKRYQQHKKSEILETLKTHRHRLRALGVRKLGLFGSYQRGTARRESDIDFLVVFDRPTFDSYMDTKFFLEEFISM